eukprot:4694372-Pyramimonas_sp.AAC.1
MRNLKQRQQGWKHWSSRSGSRRPFNNDASTHQARESALAIDAKALYDAAKEENHHQLPGQAYQHG